MRFVSLVLSTILLVSCVKTCVGIGELGSKERPVVFSLEGWRASSESSAAFGRIQDCMEKNAGFRVGFEIFADASSVVRSLQTKRAQFGLFDSIPFVSEGMGQGLIPIYIVGNKQDFAKSAVIIGPASQNPKELVASSLHFDRGSSAMSLQKAHKGTFAYLSQESAEGFLVPRHMMLEAGVLPSSAIFGGEWHIVEDLVRQEKADMGVLSDEYVKSEWGVEEAKAGMTHNGVTILAISPPFPKRVLAAEKDTSERLMSAIVKGLRTCAGGIERDAIENTFSGIQFETANAEDFTFLKDIIEFQRTFVRVLPENESID